MKHSLAAKLITNEIRRYERQIGMIYDDMVKLDIHSLNYKQLEAEKAKLIEFVNQLLYSLHILKSK